MAVFFDDLRALLDGQTLTPQRVCELLAERYGGERVYIPRRCTFIEVKATDTPKTLIAQGVPRRTAYNWITRWRP